MNEHNGVEERMLLHNKINKRMFIHNKTNKELKLTPRCRHNHKKYYAYDYRFCKYDMFISHLLLHFLYFFVTFTKFKKKITNTHN